jgi:hypothetical protein
MPKYRVKPGMRHGAGNQYGPGDEVELTEAEARGFLDKLELVPEEPPFDVATAKVEEVLAAVENGAISAAEAMQAEQAGKGRKSLIEALEALLNQDR